jgi:hypothetical protein
LTAIFGCQLLIMPLSSKVLLDHNDDDKDDLIWFADGAFLALALFRGCVGISYEHGSGGGGNGRRRKAKAMVWSFAAMNFPDVSSSLLSLMGCRWSWCWHWHCCHCSLCCCFCCCCCFCHNCRHRCRQHFFHCRF